MPEDRDGLDPRRVPLTLVTVVFDAEVTLLELQARSVARYVAVDAVHQLIVLDNCVRGLSRSSVDRLRRLYGAHGDRLRVVRTRDLIDARATPGWRSQQAAKLAVAARIETAHYVVLDAKNHFTAGVDVGAFVAQDGRAHGASHAYTDHPLRPALESTLRYLGAGDDAVARAIESFPPTATPFVFDTDAVRAMMADIAERSGSPFGVEFERRKLLEFFLYSGWLDIRGPGVSAVMDGAPVPSPTVWPKAADVAGVEAAIRESERDRAFVFAVHRQVLSRADRATRERIARFWAECGILDDERAGRALIARFRRRYLPAMISARLAERLHRVGRTQGIVAVSSSL